MALDVQDKTQTRPQRFTTMFDRGRGTILNKNISKLNEKVSKKSKQVSTTNGYCIQKIATFQEREGVSVLESGVIFAKPLRCVTFMRPCNFHQCKTEKSFQLLQCMLISREIIFF